MSYKPVTGYCALYPEEVKALSTGKRKKGKGPEPLDKFAWALYMAIRLRAWNKPTRWWETFASYLTLAKDLGWEKHTSVKIHPTNERRITRALSDLKKAQLVSWKSGNKIDKRSNDYSLDLYRRLREWKEFGEAKPDLGNKNQSSKSKKNQTHTSSSSDTGVRETRHTRLKQPDTGVGPKNNLEEKTEKTFFIKTERQQTLDSLFEKPEESDSYMDEMFNAFMEEPSEDDSFLDRIALIMNPQEVEALENQRTNTEVTVEHIRMEILDQTSISDAITIVFEDYKPEDIPKITVGMDKRSAVVQTLDRWTQRVLRGDISPEEVVNEVNES